MIPLESWMDPRFFECDWTSESQYFTRNLLIGVPEAIRGFILNFIIFVQIAEWNTMFNIIQHQKDKEVGQILYEHNAENMEEDLMWRDKSQMNFRKKEALLNKVYLCFAAVIGLSITAMKVLNLLTTHTTLDRFLVI